MTETVLREFGQEIEDLTLVPTGGGEFDVYKNGDQIFSKQGCEDFPDEDSILKILKQ